MCNGDNMSHIEQFNRRLNQSIIDKTVDDSLFKEKMDLVVQSLLRTMDRKVNACIIGAGKCQDFSLPIFMSEFDRTLVTDVDFQTIKEAVGRKPKIEIRRVEYTGFEACGFFDDFKERIVNSRDFKKIDQIIAHKIEEVKKYEFLQEEYGSMDLVYVSPIYSQLVYQQLLREVSILRETGFPEHLLKYIETVFLDEMIGVIERFNQNLIKLLHPDGMLVMLSDIFELDHGSNFHLRVVNGIKNKDVMDEIYNGYIKKYGFGLGDYGLYNLDQQVIDIRSRWMIWPFTEKKSYAVKLKIYKKYKLEGGAK